ncbi:MAG: UDP-N-acetylglucosamine diphosphorylase/glucosamine-1-phosphate N-acetyltransferase [Arenicella sp.]|jgi:UDP-N-acetylglucosamine diphosphorylase/glucosamine-1-phosphate N-acetyltransferase
MTISFDDNGKHLALAPLTFTRPVCDLRLGILTIEESWLKQLDFNGEVGYITEEYLSEKFTAKPSDLRIAGNVKPSKSVAYLVKELVEDGKLSINGNWVATKGNGSRVQETTMDENDFMIINHPWELFQNNGRAIRWDFELITSGRNTQLPSSTNTILGNNEIFIEEGAKVECAILNTTDGPIYIGKDSEIMEGSIIRAPFALCDNATIKMGAKIYGDTTIGQHCKIGGEVTNSIFYAYSNKGHDGFVGNSVIGEWCNLGADTNTSNLKNNYSNVRYYSYATKEMVETGTQFCGLIMGDHSKTGINTMLNTATNAGICANIFGGGFPPKQVKSFSWGGFDDSPVFKLDKAYEVAQNMMGRRQIELTETDKKILNHLFSQLA